MSTVEGSTDGVDLDRYGALLFDCDGVVLDSNRLKTRAFREVASEAYGDAAAEELVTYHRRHGGVSRFEKMEYLVREIIGREPSAGEVGALCDRFAERVEAGLADCAVTPRLRELRRATRDRPWYMVSGGEQGQLERTLERKGLAPLFDGGVFGSPSSKLEIFHRLLAAGLPRPAVYLGDSLGDHGSARDAGLEFVFVHGWSEVEGWREVFAGTRVPCVRRLADLLAADGGSDPPEAP